MKKSYLEMSKDELLNEYSSVKKDYDALKAQGISIDMSRGKPASDQLDLSNGMLTVLDDGNFKCEAGVDVRNYGVLSGIPECKRMFAELLSVKPENVIVGGNSSLTMMYDYVSQCMYNGAGFAPWASGGKVKFLCPVPGYDRHFAICEYFGIEMINIPMHDDGPDVDMIEEYIKDGKVSVNGKILTDLSYKVNIKSDIVCLNGEKLSLPQNYVYYKLNKPKGYMCTASDDRNRKTIYDLVKSPVRLFSIGRLDYDTEGLIILTNDGDIAQKISHFHYSFTLGNNLLTMLTIYIVKIEGLIKESELAVLRAGVIENGVRMPSAKVEMLDIKDGNSRVSVTIHEGQNRQIRRMFDCIGKTIIMLIKNIITIAILPTSLMYYIFILYNKNTK